MKKSSLRTTLVAMSAVCGLLICVVDPARAQIADLTDVPLGNQNSTPVLPNLMYILDDSGSMAWDYMPDNVWKLVAGNNTTMNNCKTASGSAANLASTQCADQATSTNGEPPYYAAQFNQIYYNPDIQYSAAVNSLGISLGDQNPTAAMNDAYLNKNTLKNLTTTYPEVYYCTVAAPAAADLVDPTVCRRNGVDNVNVSTPYFLYWSNNTSTASGPLGGFPVATGVATTTFNQQTVKNTGHPYYFRITPNEYCSDVNLVNCALATASGASPGAPFVIPAPIRYCGTAANAASTAVISDAVGTAVPKCTKKFDDTNFRNPRYGRFTRTDIVPGTATYPMSATAIRHDCAAANFCTYTEELQNFANWYSYYRTRLAMMKTATGHAFVPVNDRYRVGFITINPNSPVSNTKYLPLSVFNAAQRSSWYTILYGQNTNGSTPLREALARIGRHYGGKTDGINNGMNTDPLQYSCQQNFSLLTTDGYWNSSPSVQLDGSTLIGNQDNVPDGLTPPFVDRSTTGTLDALGATTVTGAPTTTSEQQVCGGNSVTTFGNNTGTQQACGCGTVSVSGVNVPQTRVVQRDATATTGTVTVEGITTGNTTTATTYTFTNVTACTTPLVVQANKTGATYTESVLCTKNSNGSFTHGGPTNISCSKCSTNNSTKNLILRLTWTGVSVTTTTVDGVVFSTSNPSGGSQQLASSNDNVTFTNFSGNTTAATCGPNSLAVQPPSPNVTGGVSGATTTNAGTTLAVTLSPNPTVTTGSTASTFTAGGTPDTLADVAMYYYKTDLRTSGTLAVNNVPKSGADFTNTQHMTTFTLGLGLQGRMDYTADYPSNANSDFAKIKNAVTGCVWSGAGTCDWPAPPAAGGTPETLDDLWHAAVNGRGLYFSASDPNSLANGLAGALAAIDQQTGAAAAAATSSQTLTSTSNLVFASTFRTVKWDGEITAQHLDPATGGIQLVKDPVTGNLVPGPIVWSADAQLDALVQATTDSRTIYTFTTNVLFPSKLKPFLFASLTAAASGGLSAQQSFFVNQCPTLSQCPTLNAVQQLAANDGTNMVNYLRGQKSNETAQIYRIRDHVLGDPVDSKPIYVKAPTFGFADNVSPTYSAFQTQLTTTTPRQAALYVGANDGMLHAFNADTGAEMWGYVPRAVFPQLSKIASNNWGVQHVYSVDGSPEIMDVYDTAAQAWKTILVGGLNKGGRSYYALDVTDPANPVGMWEWCSDSTVCTNSDTDLGDTYGNAVITKRKSDGRWVAIFTSGYNNVSPGGGHGWLFVVDAITGALLNKVDTGAGTVGTPSGFGKIAAFADSFFTDNTALYVYGGDLLGNLWRFDMSVNPPTVLLMATLKDSTGKIQSITTRPELGVISGNRVVFVGTGRYLGSSDLVDPATLAPPLPFAYGQSFYAIKDTNGSYGNPRATLVQQTLIDNGGITRSTSNNTVNFAVNNGWFIDFNPGNTSPGERVNIDPFLALGTLSVHTNVPNNNACTTGGDFFTYFFNFATGTYVSTSSGKVAGTRTYGSLVVGSNLLKTSTGAIISLDTTDQGKLQPSQAPIGGVPGAGRRVSWRELLH